MNRKPWPVPINVAPPTVEAPAAAPPAIDEPPVDERTASPADEQRSTMTRDDFLSLLSEAAQGVARGTVQPAEAEALASLAQCWLSMAGE